MQKATSPRLKMMGVSIEPSRRMQGQGLPWDHEIQIALPPSYHKTKKRYPVLWVTDGLFGFETAVNIANGPGLKSHPEMIVVGVGAPPEAWKEFQKRRTYDFSPPSSGEYHSELLRKEAEGFDESFKARDMPVEKRRGGASSFLTFLLEAVRPALSRDYRMADDHTLFGSSGGGIFCAYTLLARPNSFKRYICNSPAFNYGEYDLFKMEEQYAKTHKDLPAKVFFGAGEGEILEGGIISAWGIVSSMARMAETLKLRQYPSLDLHVRIFPGEIHGTTNVLSLRWGLVTLFEGESEGAQK